MDNDITFTVKTAKGSQTEYNTLVMAGKFGLGYSVKDGLFRTTIVLTGSSANPEHVALANRLAAAIAA